MSYKKIRVNESSPNFLNVMTGKLPRNSHLCPGVNMVIYYFTFHWVVLLVPVQVKIYILHSILSTLLQSTSKNLCLYLKTSTKTPRMLRLPFIWIQYRCAYYDQCDLKNAFHFLFVGLLYRPVPTCSTKNIVLLTYYQVTISPYCCPSYILLPLPLHPRPSIAELPCRYNHSTTDWFWPTHQTMNITWLWCHSGQLDLF